MGSGPDEVGKSIDKYEARRNYFWALHDYLSELDGTPDLLYSAAYISAERSVGRVPTMPVPQEFRNTISRILERLQAREPREWGRQINFFRSEEEMVAKLMALPQCPFKDGELVIMNRSADDDLGAFARLLTEHGLDASKDESIVFIPREALSLMEVTKLWPPDDAA